jgi:hypothetical protein
VAQGARVARATKASASLAVLDAQAAAVAAVAAVRQVHFSPEMGWSRPQQVSRSRVELEDKVVPVAPAVTETCRTISSTTCPNPAERVVVVVVAAAAALVSS